MINYISAITDCTSIELYYRTRYNEHMTKYKIEKGADSHIITKVEDPEGFSKQLHDIKFALSFNDEAPFLPEDESAHLRRLSNVVEKIPEQELPIIIDIDP